MQIALQNLLLQKKSIHINQGQVTSLKTSSQSTTTDELSSSSRSKRFKKHDGIMPGYDNSCKKCWKYLVKAFMHRLKFTLLRGTSAHHRTKEHALLHKNSKREKQITVHLHECAIARFVKLNVACPPSRIKLYFCLNGTTI